MAEKDNILRRQIDRIELRAVDEVERSVVFVASTNAVDTYGTVLPVDRWDLSRFAKNGVIGYQHDIYYSDDPDNVIGRGEAYVEGDALLVKVYFEPADLNKKADKVFRKIIFGSLSAVSVGFRATAPGHWGKEVDGEDPNVYYYNGQELMEVSVVNIPSNPEAVKRSAEEERAAHEAEREAPAPEQPEQEEQIPEPETKAADPDDSHIRLTIAKAQRLLAQNNIKQ